MSTRAERMQRAKARVAEMRKLYEGPEGTMRRYIGRYPLVIAAVAVERDVPYLLKLTERLMQMIEEGGASGAAGEPEHDSVADTGAAAACAAERAGTG